ncbi:MAG: hypothetical protein ACYDCN_05595 [Bacteroidia bacterium]
MTVSSQDLKLKCADKEIDCQNGNKNHFEMVVHCPYEETDTLHLPQTIKDNAKKYLIERIGNEFYNKLNYYACQVVDFKKYKEIKKQKGWISKASDRRVKYAIQYYFIIQDSMRYYLSVVFDKDGNIISSDQLPNYKNNGQFDKIIGVCDTKLIAEQDTMFSGRLLNISLEYLANANTFVWRVEKPSIAGTKRREEIHRFILINAVSGQIVKRETESWTSVCEGNSF